MSYCCTKKKVICAKNRIFLYIDFFFYCVMFLTVFHTTVFLSFFLLNVDFSKLKTRYLLLQTAKMMNSIFDKTEKIVRKEKCWLLAFSSFLTMFS